MLMTNNIETILTERGLSIYRLSKSTKLSYNTTHSLVKAEAIPDGTAYGTLKKIAKVLGVRIDDLESDN
jgi:DNA-binding Xre family transcriptional regulator